MWKVGDIVVLKPGQRKELQAWTPEYWKGVELDEPLKVLAVDVVSGGVHVRVACLRNGLPIQVGTRAGWWLACRFECYTDSTSAQAREKCALTSKPTPRSYDGLSWEAYRTQECTIATRQQALDTDVRNARRSQLVPKPARAPTLFVLGTCDLNSNPWNRR